MRRDNLGRSIIMFKCQEQSTPKTQEHQNTKTPKHPTKHYLRSMKRLFIWILILQFATGHNLLEEALRLPMLLDHYRLHQSETPGLSFGAFLKDHYLNLQHQHQCDAHAQLPLHCSHGALAESTLPCPLPAVFPPYWENVRSDAGLPVDDSLLPTGNYESGLFRPPIA